MFGTGAFVQCMGAVGGGDFLVRGGATKIGDSYRCVAILGELA